METLPLEVFCKVVDYLELPDLRNSIRVNSNWRLIISGELWKRQNIWIAFENEDQLMAFNHQFAVVYSLPTCRFHFGDDILCEASSRPFIKEFAEKFGNFARAYSFKTEYCLPGGDEEMLGCIQDNIGLLFNNSLGHLVELIVNTNCELGTMRLPGNFQELRKVAIKYNLKQYDYNDKTFLLDLSERVPRICEFGIHSEITGANQDKQFPRKLQKILQNLAQMNKSVKVQLTFRIYSGDISTLQHLVTMSNFPKVSKISLMLMTSTWSIDTDDSWKWTTSGYKRCYNAITKLLTSNAHCLKKLTLQDTSRTGDSDDEDEDEDPPIDLILPKLVALEQLNIESFHVYTSVGLHPFHDDYFPKLQSLSLNVETILWFPESKWERIKTLYLYAAKDEPINIGIPERLPLLFPNTEFLIIHWKLVLVQLALKLPNLIKLKIIHEEYEDGLDYWKIFTGMEDKATFAGICNVFGKQGRIELEDANNGPMLHDYRKLKSLQRVEIESDSTEVVGALLFMSMTGGNLGRLKELIFRFEDETIFPGENFIEELRLHHDSVKTLKCTARCHFQ